MLDPHSITHADCMELLDISKDFRERGKFETALWLVNLVERVRPVRFLDDAEMADCGLLSELE